MARRAKPVGTLSGSRELLKGAKELDAKLAALGATAGEKVMRAALRAAMKPTLEKVKAAAPEGDRAHRTYKGRLVSPGFAKRSLRLVVPKMRDGKKFRIVLGVRAEAFYAVQFWEFGVRGRPPQPWLTPAFEADKENVIARFKEQLAQRIERVAKGQK